VYATLLEKWLGADAQQILAGNFAAMNFI
jgi:uncharacterized protein (DUF1501 family)